MGNDRAISLHFLQRAVQARLNADQRLFQRQRSPQLEKRAKLWNWMETPIKVLRKQLRDEMVVIFDGGFARKHSHELEREIISMKHLFQPSNTHAGEFFQPRAGGDGLRLPLFRSDHFLWSYHVTSPIFKRHRNIASHLAFRLLNASTPVPWLRGEKARRDTHVFLQYFPPATKYQRHFDGHERDPGNFVVTVLHMAASPNDPDAHVFLYTPSNDRLLIPIKAGRTIVFATKHVEIEFPASLSPRFFATTWLRASTGFGIRWFVTQQ